MSHIESARGLLVLLVIAMAAPACEAGLPELPGDVVVQDVALLRQLGGPDAFGVLRDIERIGQWLALMDVKPLGGDEQVLILDRNSGQIVSRMGAKGEGPGEIVRSLSIASVPGQSSQLSVYDHAGHRVSIFEVSNEKGKFVRSVNYPGAGAVIQAAWLDNNKVVLAGEFVDHWLRFVLFDSGSEPPVEIDRSGTPPGRDLPPQVAMMWNWTTMSVSPDRQRIALAFMYPSRVTMVDSNGEVLADANTPIAVEPRFKFDGIGARPDKDAGARLSYVDVATTDQYVLALFSGTPEPLWGEAQDVHVFTWDGELVGVLRLEAPIQAFTVDRRTNQVYGIRFSPVSVVLEFEPHDIAAMEAERATRSDGAQ